MIEIVVEGKTDLQILTAILTSVVSPDLFRITAAGGFSPAISLSNTYCLRGNSPVALVLDSDSTDVEEVQRRKSLVLRSLSPYVESGRVRLFFAEPSIERWLFLAPSTVARLSKKARPEVKQQIERNPKAMLKVLMDIEFGNKPRHLKDLLSVADFKSLASKPPVADLVSFVRQASVESGVAIGQ
jgi:hypothetical protein